MQSIRAHDAPNQEELQQEADQPEATVCGLRPRRSKAKKSVQPSCPRR
jgi:hypothetical protein